MAQDQQARMPALPAPRYIIAAELAFAHRLMEENQTIRRLTFVRSRRRSAWSSAL